MKEFLFKINECRRFTQKEKRKRVRVSRMLLCSDGSICLISVNRPDRALPRRKRGRQVLSTCATGKCPVFKISSKGQHTFTEVFRISAALFSLSALRLGLIMLVRLLVTA